MKPNQRKEEKKNTNIICYSSFFSSFFGSVHGCSTVGPRRKSNSIFLRQPWANMDGRWPRKAAHRWYERYPTSVSSVRRQRSSSVSFGLSSAGLSKFLSVTNNLDLLGSSRQIVCDLEFGSHWHILETGSGENYVGFQNKDTIVQPLLEFLGQRLLTILFLSFFLSLHLLKSNLQCYVNILCRRRWDFM